MYFFGCVFFQINYCVAECLWSFFFNLKFLTDVSLWKQKALWILIWSQNDQTVTIKRLMMCIYVSLWGCCSYRIWNTLFYFIIFGISTEIVLRPNHYDTFTKQKITTKQNTGLHPHLKKKTEGILRLSNSLINYFCKQGKWIEIRISLMSW